MKKLLSAAVALALLLALSACGGGKTAEKHVDLPAILEKFNLSDEMLPLETSELCDVYYFDAADIKQSAAAVHSSGINCDEIILIEATSGEAATRVNGILAARLQSKLNETENYLPDEHAIIEKCSVTQNGNYVAMIVAPNAADLVKIYEDSFK